MSEERPRVDYLFLRKTQEPPLGDAGRTLRGLWPHITHVMIAELKSIGRPYRKGDLDRLWGYVHLYYAGAQDEMEARSALRAALIVPCRTPSLEAEAGAMGLRWTDLGAGYWELGGGLFPLYLAEIDVIALHEDDGLLRSFGHDRVFTPEARRFWAEQLGTKESKMSVQDLEGYDEVLTQAEQAFLDEIPPERRLAGLTPEQRQAILDDIPPEQRLAGLAPEQRLAGLAPEQVVLSLPDDVLRALSEDYLTALPTEIREAVRQRIGR